MTAESADTHERAIRDQFSRQAVGFAAAPELHADDIVALVVDAAKPQPGDRAIDLACGPGTVACALAQRVQHVIGLDSTLSMLEQARALAQKRSVENVEWHAGDVYQTPFGDGSFNIVTCRFAFHHFENPVLAFAEMVRLAAPGGRVVVCDGLASDEPAKAEAFNAMERRRDPSTVEFRDAALPAPPVRCCRSRRPLRAAVRPLLSGVRPRRALVSSQRRPRWTAVDDRGQYRGRQDGRRRPLDARRRQVRFPFSGAQRGEARPISELSSAKAYDGL